MPNPSSDQSLSSFSDELLVGELRMGNMEAFTLLFKRHSRRAVELAATIVAGHFEAEEIVSDVFYSFWARRAELPVIPVFRAYLFTAVRYRAQTVLLQQKRQLRVVSLENYEPEVPETVSFPLEPLHSVKLIHVLRAAIEQLPAQRKLIFKLKRLDGLSYKAIAELLDISENTVRNQLVAALKTLREQLSAHQSLLFMLLVVFQPSVL